MDSFKRFFLFLFQDFYSPFKESNSRILVIDLARFLAIILMVIFHFGYDLNLLGIKEVNIQASVWWALPRIIITLFLLSSGLSLNLSPKEKITENWPRIWPRALKLGLFALIITITTMILFPKNWVYFGTLHCLASCSLLSLFFLSKKWTPLILGIGIQLNYFLEIIPFKDPMDSISIKSVDYISLYPWVGIFFIGMGLSSWVQKYSPKIPPGRFKLLSRVSQKSLPIYLLHQPLLIALLSIFKLLFI